MENNFEENSLSSLLTAVNDAKSTVDNLKIRRIVGKPKIELRDPYACSAILDFCMVSAAFQYYKENEKNVSLDISNLSNSMWDKSYALIKDIDCIQSVDSNDDLGKTLFDLQMDADFISEWPKFNTDFLNMCNFFDDQSESNDILSNPSTICKNQMDEKEFSNPMVVNFETSSSELKDYSKNLDNDTSVNTLVETGDKSFETKFVISKSSFSPSQHSTNTNEDNSVLKCSHGEGYFPEELDYEPSDTGETETKESDNEFYIDNTLKEEETKSFSNYCPTHASSENSTFQKKDKDVDSPKKQTEICPHTDFVSFFQNNFDPLSSKSKFQNNYERGFEYDDEDDSESDSEHSFKRNSSRNIKVNNQKSLQQPIINSTVFKDNHLNNINEVMLYISEQCISGNINEAITVANKYIAISVESMQLEIFKELFINVIDFIKNSIHLIDDAWISRNFGKIMNIFHRSKLFNSDLCSLIVSECFNCDCTVKTGKKFFSFVQKIKVPVNSNAVSSYVGIMIFSEISSLELISFMEYVKCVCNLLCPKTVLTEVLERFSKQEENNLLVGFFRLCKFLCSVSSLEVDINSLQNFIKFCIKNDWWIQIANFFQAWYKDGNLIACLNQSFLFHSEDVGMFYEKLAKEVYRHGDVPLQLVGILGQMGVSMMLEVFSRKQYQSAFEVLFILHKHNINYMGLQLCLYNAPSFLKSFPKFSDIFVLPFTVAFAALDICLHLKRFQDAYCIFKSFSLNLPDYMEDTLKLEVRHKRFGYLLNLAQELYSKDHFKLGLQALCDICVAVKEIQVIYNKYLIYIINGCQFHTALELFEHSDGVMKELFVIQPQVLRGLFVTFAENGRIDEAYKFFSLGCARKIYNIEQIEQSAWCLTIMSSWTFFEVEFVTWTFIKNVSLAWNGKYKTGFGMQLSSKILFKESEEDCLEIKCLKKSHNIGSTKEITCKVLHSLDSNIKWVEVENPVGLKLVPSTINNFWMNTSPNFFCWKNSRENLFEDIKPNAEFKIQLSEENVDCKYSTHSDSMKTLDTVSSQLTPEYSVPDSSYQFFPDKVSHQSLSHPKNSPHMTPEETILDITHHQLMVLKGTEQEQIISSSNQLSPDTHSSKTTCWTPDGKISKIAPKKNSTDVCFEDNNQLISKKRVCNKIKVFKNLRRLKSKNGVSKTVQLKNKFKKIHSKKCNKNNSKKLAILPQKAEKSLSKSEYLCPESSKQACSSESWKTENFRITLNNSAQDGKSRMVNHVSEVKLAEPKEKTKVSNVPEAVFQKIVLFLQSKVLLKCKDLQPEQQQEKVNHLANLFIQSNVVGVLDKKTMKLLSGFAESSI
ncbi:uncharacterized protein LOC129976307 isoform X2 [Argiope bruennichi]|uniref:uncharacterized protein LOC129976307 isoform X2 n=1 Tax=Argiope bruennichi TaxID=94029 RepID=UPI0024953703|nr:uncharacterized protein LOC129976307 isoform X2 [Argiope bruennichi]